MRIDKNGNQSLSDLFNDRSRDILNFFKLVELKKVCISSEKPFMHFILRFTRTL